MNYKVYSLYDKLADEYLPVFPAKNDKTAVKLLVSSAMSAGRDISDIVAKYKLLAVGSFDSVSGLDSGLDAGYPYEVDVLDVYDTLTVEDLEACREAAKDVENE